jgi:hypothetical protein
VQLERKIHECNLVINILRFHDVFASVSSFSSSVRIRAVCVVVSMEEALARVIDPHGVHFVNRNCGTANAARYNQEPLNGEWRTIRHDAIARVAEGFARESGFQKGWQPGPLAGLPARGSQG